MKEEAMKSGSSLVIATAAVAISIVSASAALRSPVNVSGYENFLGTTINSQPATCGVNFSGWTGGGGQSPGSWVSLPGNGKGLWNATVNYSGKAAFGRQVTVKGGSFNLLFTSGRTVLGKVTGGTVRWPARGLGIGCGRNVAVISVSISYRFGAVGTGSFRGCLHDLPAGSVLPPKFWGTLQ
jgi:hypothetical protein